MKYRIMTESGKYYDIDHAGRITRTNSGRKPSGGWICLGFCEILAFGHTGNMITINELLTRSNNGWTTFKNGKGKYRLIDRDHGTARIWGDAIRAVWEVPEQ